MRARIGVFVSPADWPGGDSFSWSQMPTASLGRLTTLLGLDC